mmetsp:Transcript_117502/g.165223  ORF Transcript_117502/g.165223 Transcript_117502/m.165223 type:complete len:252 (-) Transcript_117502:63-818(-)
MPAKKPAPAKKSSSKKKKPQKYQRFENLFESRPRNFSIGQDLPPKRDVTRFVRWPKYVRVQRQKRMLERRLKVPPTINQFRSAFGERSEVMKFAAKYKPESPKEKRERQRREAEDKAGSMNTQKGAKKPELKFGIKRVTRLIESQRAKLVLIAHDVVPLEIVVFLPALCKKANVPFAIVKSKSALGRLAGYKTATCAAFVDVRSQDTSELASLADACKNSFNEKRPSWGGLSKGRKGKKTGRLPQKKKKSA